MFDRFLNCRGGGGGGGGSIPVFLSKPTFLWSAKTRARMCVCLYVGCLEPHSPPLDPYILDTCDLFVLLCYMLGLSSIRVKFSGLLYIMRASRGGGVRTHGKSQYYRVSQQYWFAAH